MQKGESEDGAVPLQMANVVGVFYVLSFGVIYSFFAAFIAVVIDTWTVCKENKVRSFKYEIHYSKTTWLKFSPLPEYDPEFKEKNETIFSPTIFRVFQPIAFFPPGFLFRNHMKLPINTKP